MAMSTEQMTQELFDREKIRELTAWYCFYVMTNQREKVPTLFAEDASFLGNAGPPAHALISPGTPRRSVLIIATPIR